MSLHDLPFCLPQSDARTGQVQAALSKLPSRAEPDVDGDGTAEAAATSQDSESEEEELADITDDTLRLTAALQNEGLGGGPSAEVTRQLVDEVTFLVLYPFALISVGCSIRVNFRTASPLNPAPLI